MRRAAHLRGQPVVGWSSRQRALVHEQLPGLLRTALVYLGTHERAEALVEQTLRAAARSVLDEEDPTAWLHAHLWARFRAAPRDGGAAGNGTSAAAALAALPPPQRAAVQLVDGEGLSYAQLARVLDTDLHEAASLLHDARRQLRPVLTAIPPVTAGTTHRAAAGTPHLGLAGDG